MTTGAPDLPTDRADQFFFRTTTDPIVVYLAEQKAAELGLTILDTSGHPGQRRWKVQTGTPESNLTAGKLWSYVQGLEAARGNEREPVPEAGDTATEPEPTRWEIASRNGRLITVTATRMTTHNGMLVLRDAKGVVFTGELSNFGYVRRADETKDDDRGTVITTWNIGHPYIAERLRQTIRDFGHLHQSRS